MDKVFGFDSYVCCGDESTIERDGYQITATVEPDADSSPHDYECYGESEINAWMADEWRYVGIVLSVSYKGVTLDDSAASLWGVECNFPGTDNSYLATVAEELLPEAMDVAVRRRAEIVAALSC